MNHDTSPDFLVVAALKEEAAAFEALLTEVIDAPTYKLGTIARPDGRADCVVALSCVFAQGTAMAQQLTSNLIARLHPRAVIMIGIAAGFPEHGVESGDLLIPARIWPYELAKITSDQPSDTVTGVSTGSGLRREHRGVEVGTTPSLWQQACNLAADSKVSWNTLASPVTHQPHKPAFHYLSNSVIGSGDKLVATDLSAERQSIVEKFGKNAIGLEMEAYGVATACTRNDPYVAFLVVKAVQDPGTTAKDDPLLKDLWRPFACNASALFVARLIARSSVSEPVGASRSTATAADEALVSHEAGSMDISTVATLPSWCEYPSSYITRPGVEAEVLNHFSPTRSRHASRLVTIHGPGGSGKSRLAVTCAQRLARTLPNGVVCVDLEGAGRSVPAIVERIAAALGWRTETHAPEDICAAFAVSRGLLFLDGFENVASPPVAEFIASLLKAAPALRVLVASRVFVGIDGVEAIVSTDKGLTSEEAKELFLDRARLKRRDWVPTSDEDQQIDTLLSLTVGIPLAIELVAAWTNTRSLGELVDGLAEEPLGPVTMTRPRATPLHNRQRSMERCLDWSYGFLTHDAQSAFDRLGVFEAEFLPKVAETVCRVSRQSLDELQEAAITVIRADGYHGMHRFTRDYAKARFFRTADRDTIAVDFLHHYRRFIEARGKELGGQESLLKELDNCVAAYDVALRLGRPEECVTAMFAVLPVLKRAGRLTDAMRLLTSALTVARTYNFKFALQARMLLDIGELLLREGKAEAALSAYEEARVLAQKNPRPEREALAIDGIARVLGRVGRFDEAENHLKKAFRLKRTGEGPAARRGMSRTLAELGWLEMQRARHEAERTPAQMTRLRRAARWYRLSFREWGVNSNGLGRPSGLLSLSRVLKWQGRLVEAERACREGLVLCKRVEGIDALRTAGRLHQELGGILRREGNWVSACKERQRAVDLFRQAGDRVGVAASLRKLGITIAASDEGQHEALEAFRESREFFHVIGDLEGEARVLDESAKVRARLGDALEAQREAALAWKLREILGRPRSTAEASGDLSD